MTKPKFNILPLDDVSIAKCKVGAVVVFEKPAFGIGKGVYTIMKKDYKHSTALLQKVKQSDFE